MTGPIDPIAEMLESYRLAKTVEEPTGSRHYRLHAESAVRNWFLRRGGAEALAELVPFVMAQRPESMSHINLYFAGLSETVRKIQSQWVAGVYTGSDDSALTLLTDLPSRLYSIVYTYMIDLMHEAVLAEEKK